MSNYKNPVRSFEDTGTVHPSESYYVELENVGNTKNQDLKTMVDLGRYFSIFAPRQSGKTTYFKYFCHELEKEPTYIAILLSFQDCRQITKSEFYGLIQEEMVGQLIKRLDEVNCESLDAVKDQLSGHPILNHISFRKLFEKLNKTLPPKRIVVFIDEFDGIPMGELENFLLALREIYQKYKGRSDKALYSVGLVGIRNVTKLIVGGVSPFNIADQVDLPPFSFENIRDLYSQYTEETNQPFDESAVVKVHEETAGQPWLVNRLGTILTTKIKSNTTEAIIAEDVDKAVKLLIKKRNPHFENLSQKLSLHGDAFMDIVHHDIKYKPYDEEQSFLEQYGLIKEQNDKAVVANPIYRKCFSELSPSGPLSMSALSGREKKIFISYSRNDKHWLDMLRPHLSVLNYKDIQYWYDEKIRPGEDWPPEIQHAIETSQVAVCLVSANFINSKFIRNREIPELLKRRKIGLKILPFLVEPCAWKLVPWLAEIQIKDQTPLSDSAPGDQKKKLAAIVEQIAEAFDEMQG